jgi:hypothetical protein
MRRARSRGTTIEQSSWEAHMLKSRKARPAGAPRRAARRVIKGASVLVRTTGPSYVGNLLRMTRSWLVLENAAWIELDYCGDTVCTGQYACADKYPAPGIVQLSRAQVIECSPWPWEIPVHSCSVSQTVRGDR